LPALIQSVTAPDSPGFYLANAARLLTSDFRDAGRIIDPNAPEPLSAADKVRILMAKEVEGSGRILATLLYEVDSAFYYQARYPAAEPFLRRSLAIDEQNFGLDHPNVARDLNKLAQLLNDTNRVEEAELLSRRSLVILEKALGPEHPDVAQSLNSLAELATSKANTRRLSPSISGR
jgi:Tetratricopeptide repeat